MVQETDHGMTEMEVSITALPPDSFVSFSKSYNLYKPQLPYLRNGN